MPSHWKKHDDEDEDPFADQNGKHLMVPVVVLSLLVLVVGILYVMWLLGLIGHARV
jgi:hypothetical protein